MEAYFVYYRVVLLESYLSTSLDARVRIADIAFGGYEIPTVAWPFKLMYCTVHVADDERLEADSALMTWVIF